MHISSIGVLLLVPKFFLQFRVRPGHPFRRCSTVSLTFKLHFVHVGSYISAVRKLLTRGLQFANNWLRITSALRSGMLAFSFKSVWLTYTSFDGLRTLADALITSKGVAFEVCSKKVLLIASFANLSSCSFSLTPQ